MKSVFGQFTIDQLNDAETIVALKEELEALKKAHRVTVGQLENLKRKKMEQSKRLKDFHEKHEKENDLWIQAMLRERKLKDKVFSLQRDLEKMEMVIKNVYGFEALKKIRFYAGRM